MFLNIRKIQLKFREWGNDLEKVPVLGKVIRKSRTLILPGFQHIPLYDVMDYFFQSLGKGVIFQRAAALTYRIFVALIPMIIALFSVIAFLGDNVQHTLIALLQSVVPFYAWPAVGNVITDVITNQNGTLSSLMFVFGIYFTILCCNGLLATLNTSYFNEQRRNIVKQVLLSFMIMFIAFFIILVVLGMLIYASILLQHIQQQFDAPKEVFFYLVHGVKWALISSPLYPPYSRILIISNHLDRLVIDDCILYFQEYSTCCLLPSVLIKVHQVWSHLDIFSLNHILACSFSLFAVSSKIAAICS